MFTLPDTEAHTETGTDTDIDKISTEPNGNVSVSVSVQYEHFCTILYNSFFLSVSVSSSVKAPLLYVHTDWD